MPTCFSRLHQAIVFLLFLSGSFQTFAQKAGLEVTRNSAVDRSLTIKNMTVDATGRRYVSNSKGIFQVKANDFATPVPVAPGEKNVLAFSGGNADFAWSEAKFREQVNTPCSVTSAWYDSKSQTLWLGTDEAGLFQFNTQPEFKLVQQYLPVNSKLKSPHITTIFQDASGRLWVGNEDGVMYGTPGRWKNALSGFKVQRVREYNTVIYVLADGSISKAPGGEKWSDLALEEKYLEGDINDFDIDPTGKMWILSGNVSRFDLLANTYEEFGGSEYYTSQYGTCIAVDHDGAVWVGTEDKGLFSVDKASNMVLNAFLEAPISCEGNGRDAVIATKVTGGTPPFSYTWTGGLTGENPKNISQGTYSVTVSDSKGVSRTAEVPVPDSRLKLKVRQKKPASNATAADGSGEVDIATNASGIVVTWDNGENRVVATQLTAGEHRVTVSDPKGCTMTLTLTITVAGQPLTVELASESPIPCAGQAGLITAKSSGGKTPYKYAWSNPAFTNDKATAVAGTYTVTVTDGAGATSTASIKLAQPEPLSLNAVAQSVSSAGGADGKALAQAKGGSGVYTFKWDNGETTFTATKLTEGNHSVTATDANGCVATASVKIDVKVDAFAVILREARPIKCHGEKTSLTVAAVGGRTPYKEYKWSPEIKSIADGVTTGTYTVTATDNSGATATATIVIKEPKKLSVSTILQLGTSPGKEDGKALAVVEGGTGAMFFKWDNGEVTAATNMLPPGLHYVTVTDENGCTASAPVMIPEGLQPVTLTVKETAPIRCAGEKTTLDIQSSGGKGAIKYTWNVQAISGLKPSVGAGEYTITATDAAGNTATAAITVKQPEPFSATAQVTSAAGVGAADGKALAKASGGTAPYAYKWSNGETSAEAVKLPAGNHTVAVTDANGCTANAGISVSENILPLSASISASVKAKCAGEKTTLTVDVAGGKKPFTYTWSNNTIVAGKPVDLVNGNYIVTVSDAVGTTATAAYNHSQPEALTASAQAQSPASVSAADGKALAKASGGTAPYAYKWSTGETAPEATKCAAGTHTVTIVDANNCSATATVSISENILPLTANIVESAKAKCAGDQITLGVEVAGGKKPYSYKWSNPSLEAGRPANLVNGTYVVTVTDQLGASTTASLNLKQPDPLAVAVDVQAPASAGNTDGKALANPSGGTAPYIYAWTSGESTNTATRLAPGPQSVKVTDANGCVATGTLEVTENILTLTIALTEKTPIKCAGEKATLNLKIAGGKTPYTYNWSSAALSADNLSGLDAGDYAVTVTDAKGTTKTAALSVKAPSALSVELVRNIGATTDRSSDGKAELSVKGGTPKYNILWDTKQTGLSAPKLPLGKHSVTVTDANG
ncbi:MAG: hypothetical protein JNJ57_06570, partial [Saprospiraceae bacterium]|nr:hypothetical protein [Saprospiraceae bacterium]